MTNKEAINILTAKAECIRREVSGTDFAWNLRNCDECDLCYAQGTTGEQREALDMAIKALEKQIPKKPTKQTDEWSQSLYNLRCPQCNAVVAMGNSRVGYCDRINKGYEICRACGQAIDWTEGE